jgi:predicted DNA-binding transcriptional regulator AlpA
MAPKTSLTDNAHSNLRTGLAKTAAVADFLGTTVPQLTRLRWEGKGPSYVRLGRSIRYRWSDVDAWVEANVQSGRR